MSKPDPAGESADEQGLVEAALAGAERVVGRIELSEYDPAWPARYQREAARVRSALGHKVIRLEHVGSTSVPGLAAKPIIDIVLEVPDSSDEPAYVEDLQRAGYVLRIREPEWFEHRFLKRAHVVNLHVFSAACAETERMVQFRDWLRTNASDRALYARVKRELASREWTFVQQYADAKTEVITSILTRASTPPAK